MTLHERVEKNAQGHERLVPGGPPVMHAPRQCSLPWCRLKTRGDPARQVAPAIWLPSN